MKEKFEKAELSVIRIEEDIITTSGQHCGCPSGNTSGDNHHHNPWFPWFPWFWW